MRSSKRPDVRVRRVYEDPAPDQDGPRVLADRLSPWGVSKDAARLDDVIPEVT